ncbi:MAG: hypothetical protein ACREX6_01035 [Casimicrobiaceae bacterium]
MTRLSRITAIAFAVAIGLSGCAGLPGPSEPAVPGASITESAAPAAAARVDPFASVPNAAVQDRLLALDPDHLTDSDVREVLAGGPAPRIILLHGGVFPAYLLMKSFGIFLTRMGYPESAIRDPDNDDWSYSPYDDNAEIAGIVAWAYERSGLRPMLIGHSLGGIQTVRTLQDLAGDFGSPRRVFDPVSRRFEERTTITDPYTGRPRPVVGLSVSYASATAAGGAGFLLAKQWPMVDRLQNIPDTVDEFTGFSLDVDLIAWNFPGDSEQYRATGTARVRNVVLPDTYSHMFVPLTASLPQDPAVRAWINAWTPDGHEDPSTLPAQAQRHVLWAADVWYSVKRHWCLEAQHLVRAWRARNHEGTPDSGKAPTPAVPRAG